MSVDVKAGVCQGSVLNPLLFVPEIERCLGNAVRIYHKMLYVDDLILVTKTGELWKERFVA